MRKIGKITAWNDEKGFGFISPSAGGKSIFFHVSALDHRNRRSKINQPVSYTLSTDKFGRPCAVKVRLARDRHSQKRAPRYRSISVLAAAFFMITVSIAVLLSKLPSFILVAYTLLSIITFVIYAVDKSAAVNGTWRTRESTLHLLSLAGGWPGALVAQTILRHKSKKNSFRTGFWITVTLNLSAFVWLLN